MSQDRPGDTTGDPAVRERKRALRAEVRATRRSTDPDQRSLLGRAWSDRVLDAVGPLLRTDAVVAAYVSYGTEPPTAELIAALGARGVRVIVPVLEADRDLDWSAVGATDLLGRDTIADASVVVVPALAAGVDGARLGQGGGSYDRALARVPDGVPVVALVHDDEVRDVGELPVEPYDRRVTHVVTPTRVLLTGQEPPSAPSA